MLRMTHTLLLGFLAGFSMLCLIVSPVSAQTQAANSQAEAAEERIGQIKTLNGSAFVVRKDKTLLARKGLKLLQSDIIITGGDGSVGMTFDDNSLFSLGPNSTLHLETFRFNATTHDGEFVAGVKRGTLAVISGEIAKRSPDAMKIRTLTSILGVRGTKFVVRVDD